VPSRSLEHLDQILAVDSVAFGLADVVHDDGAALAPGLAPAALLLGLQVTELAGFQRGLGLSFS
jgi:hypothetical protein